MMSVLALERNTLKITLVMSLPLLSLGFFQQKLLLQTGRHLDSMQTFSKQQGSRKDATEFDKEFEGFLPYMRIIAEMTRASATLMVTFF